MKLRLPRRSSFLPAALLFLGGVTCGFAASYAPDWIGKRMSRHTGIIQISSNGTQEWFLKGCRHRLGGPAIERPDGRKEWWEYGEFIRSESPYPKPGRRPGDMALFD